jgi:23S rRNA pseudouridine1911/1915/1917 synthase
MGEANSTDLGFTIDTDQADARLDAFLASQIEGWSRARLQRLIENEDVLVNGKPSKPSYKLRAHDKVEVELIAPATAVFTPENIPVEIVYEDETLVVVNKPAGLVVHPAAGSASGTLANALAYHFQQLPGSNVRPGIVHRLDRDTSGLLVVAKTEAALENLSDQFRDRTVYKSYVALVHGRVSPDSGKIDQPLARDPANRTRMAGRARRTQRVDVVSRATSVRALHASRCGVKDWTDSSDPGASRVAEISGRRR